MTKKKSVTKMPALPDWYTVPEGYEYVPLSLESDVVPEFYFSGPVPPDKQELPEDCFSDPEAYPVYWFDSDGNVVNRYKPDVDAWVPAPEMTRFVGDDEGDTLGKIISTSETLNKLTTQGLGRVSFKDAFDLAKSELEGSS